MNTKQRFSNLASLASVAACVFLTAAPTQAAPLALSDTPLFLTSGVPPLNMLVMGRDHKLYYEAYNDHSDLNNDGVLDTKYKPTQIDYYGYFDSKRCYDYQDSDPRHFYPVSETANKKCPGHWSGDFLNYISMSRMDAMRKVLYGGYRSTDTATLTILERSHIPQDAHSWGKEYSATDGYLINEYTPLAMPATGKRHLFANTTPLGESSPRLRILTDRDERIWNWVSRERPVAGTNIDGGTITAFNYEFRVRVKVCDNTTAITLADGSSEIKVENNCQPYPGGNSKPTGLLHDFGENDQMLFGLLTGSYAKNTSGGVLRRTVGSIKDEINATDGTFKSFNGIITTLNRLRTTGFGGSHEYGCGWTSATRVINEGECQMWGNPVAEMMYEALRYFSGKGSATPAYATTFGQGEEGTLPGNGLPVATWDNPYTDRPVCTKPFETVISDVNNSYDSDQLPGVDSNFGSFTGDVTGLDVATLGQTIWTNEIGGTHKYFVGQSGATSDGAPTPKDVSSFGNIRGLSPEEPTKQGSYYPASVSYYGRINDINSSVTGTQNLNTFAVALASPLPKIEIKTASGKKVTIVPFSKSVGGCNGADGAFKATNQIVDFYVDTLTSTYGKFRVNFEDVEQGADHDMDAITIYEYTVTGETVKVTLTSEYAAGCIIQHSGYVISGTSADGAYLVVRDIDTTEADDPDYSMDSPTSTDALPLTATTDFVAGSTAGADILQDPLWYAAKWGGFKEDVKVGVNNKPDLLAEWDDVKDGKPDNYFLVTNALTLGTELTKAFSEIIKRDASASSASVNSGSINSNSRLYQAKFNSGYWTGQLLAYNINTDGTLASNHAWDAATRIPAPNDRTILTINSNGVPAKFRWTGGLDLTRQRQLDTVVSGPGWKPEVQEDRLDYLRGVDTKEGATFRRRENKDGTPNKFGDIISSSPVYVGRPSFTYSDTLEAAAYSAFRNTTPARAPMVYVGANDGMLHGFDANTGDEKLAFIPGAVFKNLKLLTVNGYTHKFYVDGSPTMADAYFHSSWKTVLVGGLNAGGQGIYALNITNPANFSEDNAAYSSSTQNGVVMWEFTDTDRGDATDGITGNSDLGFTYSQPIVVRVRNSDATQRWVAIFGNGYNNTAADGSASSTGNAVLYVVDLATGKQIRRISTGVGQSATYSGGKPNGLGPVTASDLDGDGIVENIYAGDLFGNLWKFNLNNDSPALWKVAYQSGGNPAPLFVATDASSNRQPITSQVRIARGPGATGAVVLFGTGKFLESTDKSTTRPQTLYGVYDAYSNTDTDIVSGRSSLVEQDITHEVTGTFGTLTVEARVTTSNPITTGKRGWFLDLLTPAGAESGERMIANPRVRNGRVLYVSIVPGSDPCNPGGKSRLTELDLVTGSKPADPPFDLNGDGVIDSNDLVEITLADGTKQRVAPTSLTLIVDYATSPGVIASSTADYVFITGDDRDREDANPLHGEDLQGVRRSPGDNARGRQSWRQIR